MGSFNLALGVYLGFWQPVRADDLWTIYRWCNQWLYEGMHLYGLEDAPDYPPNAIVTYALLATIPVSWVIPVWASANLGLTLLLPYIVMRCLSPRVRLPSIITATVLFTCWGGVRTLLQFSQLSFALAFLALSMPESWILSGVCLGLALSKPHIAGPIALWAACTGRIRVTLVAATVVALEYCIYCLRVDAMPLEPVSGWLRSLGVTYSGIGALNGYTSIRPWVVALIENQAIVDQVWISVGAVTLIALCLAAVHDRTKTLAIPGLMCLWSLLTIYHNLNNLILMLPAFIFLLTDKDPDTRRQRVWAVGMIQAALMLDIPVRLRNFTDGPFGSLIIDADRLVVLGTFVFVTWSWWRRQRANAP